MHTFHAFGIQPGATTGVVARTTTQLRHRRTVLSLPLLAALWASQGNGLDIVLTDVSASPMSAAQLNAFETAAASWEVKFGDPITVNVDIAFDNLRPGILGSTATARTSVSYGATIGNIRGLPSGACRCHG